MTNANEILRQAGPGQESQQQGDRPLLNGRYQLVERLSRGSFGETYIAEDTQRPGHPQCVVKQFSPLQITDPEAWAEARRRFDQEAAVLEELGQHAQIPRLLAHFEADNEFYLVQELILGPTLQSMLITHPQWSLAQAGHLLTHLLEILVFVHSHDVIHRDIKPENILYREPDSRWVLIDFGAVKPFASVTSTGDRRPGTMAIYSEGYTPSEQIEGHPCPGSDLYSLGLVCMQCLTGQHPSTFKPHLRTQGLPWLTAAIGHPELAAILEKMTRAHWEERYQTADEALQALGAIAPSLESTGFLGNPSTTQATEAEPTSIIPTEITQPKPPTEQSKIRIPTEVITPERTTHSPPPQPSRRISLPTSQSTPTAPETSPSLWSQLPLSKIPWAKLQASAWRWLKDHNIYRIEKAIAFVISICIVLGSSTFMVVWLTRSIMTLHRATSVETGTPATADALIMALPGEAPIHDLAFSPDNTTLFSADETGKITGWNLMSQQPVQNIEDFGAVTALAISADKTWIASGDEYANVTLRNLKTGKLLHTLRDHQLPILSLVFSPDSKTLVSSAEDNSLIIWDLETFEPQHQLTDFSESINAIDINPTGRYLIGGGTDFTVKIWNLYTGKLRRSLTGHSGAVQAVAVSPKEPVLVSGSADQSIRIWNVYSGKLINTLAGHTGAVTAIAISPDGQVIVSGSEDGTIRLWHLHSGKLLQKLSNFQGPIESVELSADGQLIASSTMRGNVNVWRISEDITP